MTEHYDGAFEIERAWREGLTPDPILTVSQWADQHRVLSSLAASEPGRWRTRRTPYLRDIMDSLSPSSPVERVVFEKASQIGATEAGSNWIGYVIHHAPGPMMAVWPTVEMAKRNSKIRIDPLIEKSEVLNERIAPPRSRDSGNTILAKEFRGGVLVMTGANSAVGLRSMPVRYLFLDEVDGYPPDVEGEGDAISLAEARTRSRQSCFGCALTSSGKSNHHATAPCCAAVRHAAAYSPAQAGNHPVRARPPTGFAGESGGWRLRSGGTLIVRESLRYRGHT
jgi:phage terminase large subunit GpA-like protein